MKIKSIATACALVCSASAFAVVLDPTAAVGASFRTFYIAGASAQAPAISTVVPADLFAVPADVVKITQAAGQKSTGWYGMSKASLTGNVSVPLFVVYNSTNGSNAGVAQVLTTATTEAEANVVTVGNAGCSAVTGASGSWTSACSTPAMTEADMAVSDVRPTEAVAGVLPTTGVYPLSAFTVKTTALQGFGVVVNPNLYTALQNQNIAEGTLAASCAGDATLACQPSIRRADYASLVTAEGSISDAAALLKNSADNTVITLARRTDSSGTQAASNIFFANNVCGNLGYKGALSPVHAADAALGVKPALVVTEETGTGAVKSRVNALTGYALGVVSLENVPGATDVYKFVKIDGVSPNTDAKQRAAFANGSYPFAYEMTAMYRTASSASNKLIAEAVITGLKSSAKHDLTGIAYLDGTATVALGGKASAVKRNNNNCAPLMAQ